MNSLVLFCKSKRLRAFATISKRRGMTRSTSGITLRACTNGAWKLGRTLLRHEYRNEEIMKELIEFPDNQDVIEFIDEKRIGIISILTDECRTPRGKGSSFRDAMYKECGGKHNRFKAIVLRRGHKQFSLLHYAGPVAYDTLGKITETNANPSELLVQVS